MNGNRGQVSLAMGSGLVFVLLFVLAAIAIASFTGIMSLEEVENETHPIARDVAMSASGNALIPFALILGVIIFAVIFFSTSLSAFGGGT